MSAVVRLRGVEPIIPVPPPALAHARRLAAAYSLLGKLSDRVAHVAGGGAPLPADKAIFSELMTGFMDLYDLTTRD